LTQFGGRDRRAAVTRRYLERQQGADESCQGTI
jgi:hypothetical protein